MTTAKLFGLILALLAGLGRLTIEAAPTEMKHSDQKWSVGSCSNCHDCEVPTGKDPCLKPCIRDLAASIPHALGSAPEKILIDAIEGRYEAVAFNHKGHAHMSEMGKGCGECHHYNKWSPIAGCSECHSVKRQREDITVPDLKGALHRQCMGCHRQWNAANECSECHVLKGKKLAEKENIAKGNVSLKGPERISFATEFDDGEKVEFYHNQHAGAFQIACTQCHKNEGCGKCHNTDKKSADVIIGKSIPEDDIAHHQACFACHENDDCDNCHKTQQAKAFDHAVHTGWPLKIYHQKISCRKCHTTSPRFSKVSKDCVQCHQTWPPESFRHEVTGIKLSDDHGDADCESCHLDKNFSKPADCGECHDEGEHEKLKEKLRNASGKINAQ